MSEKLCYLCGLKPAVIKTLSGVPCCSKCYPTEEEKPLRIDDVTNELDRMRKELADDFDDDKKRTPTITKPWWEGLKTETTSQVDFQVASYGEWCRSVIEKLMLMKKDAA